MTTNNLSNVSPLAYDHLKRENTRLKRMVAGLESRLSALESRPLTTESKNGLSKGATDPNQDRFKAAVLEFWNAGTRGYGPIATALATAGYRNSNGNFYSREMVKRTLVRAGLVA